MQLIKHSLSNKFEVKINGYSVLVRQRELFKQNRLVSHITRARINRQDAEAFLEAFKPVTAPMLLSEWCRLVTVAMANLQTVED